MNLQWKNIGDFKEIIYLKNEKGIAKISINRPHRRNAFTPQTINELIEAFRDANQDTTIGVILLAGENPQTDGKYAFCAGGDQKTRGEKAGGYLDENKTPQLNVLELAKVNSNDS